MQKQVAGNNSEQLQVDKVFIYQGVSEERVRKIYAEMIPQSLKEYTQEAYDIANKRITNLENIVIPQIMKLDNNTISVLADPSFQIMIRKAQQTAAATDSLDDYSLLSELIMYHIQKGDNKKNRIGISKAIEIVDDIDNDALCALTVAYAFQSYIPKTGNLREGLQLMDSLFRKLLYMELPTGNEWLDHLDILDAVRMNPYGKVKTIKEYYSEVLNGYICVGIKKDSDEYKKAREQLISQDFDTSILGENELVDGYARLMIPNRESIFELLRFDKEQKYPINDNEKLLLEGIWNLYSQDGLLNNRAKEAFITIWDSYASLRQVRLWWEKIQTPFEITKIGQVLAHTNAKRCEPDLPEIL